MGGGEAGQEGRRRVGEVAVVRVDRVRREPAHYGTHQNVDNNVQHVSMFCPFCEH